MTRPQARSAPPPATSRATSSPVKGSVAELRVTVGFVVVGSAVNTAAGFVGLAPGLVPSDVGPIGGVAGPVPGVAGPVPGTPGVLTGTGTGTPVPVGVGGTTPPTVVQSCGLYCWHVESFCPSATLGSMNIKTTPTSPERRFTVPPSVMSVLPLDAPKTPSRQSYTKLQNRCYGIEALFKFRERNSTGRGGMHGQCLVDENQHREGGVRHERMTAVEPLQDTPHDRLPAVDRRG